MQSINPNGAQVVFIIQQPTSTTAKQICYTNMRTNLAKQLIALGTLQIIIGLLCIIFQAASLGITLSYGLNSLAFVGDGIWLGVLFIVTGLIGIVGGVKKKRCCVISFNVLSIISAIVLAELIIVTALSALVYSFNSSGCYYPYTCQNYVDSNVSTGIALESVIAILGLLEAIFAIWSSVVCCSVGACCCECSGSCCCPPSTAQVQQMISGQAFGAQQPFTNVVQGQAQTSQIQQMPMLMANQPMMYLVPGQQPAANFKAQQLAVQYFPQQPNPPPIQHDDYTQLSHEASSNQNAEIYTDLDHNST